MSVGFRATGSSTFGERISALPSASSPFAQDLALAQGAAAQNARAQKQLAQRLIVRTRRAAHALMAGSADADDAAQHALIELLRMVHAYGGDVSLEQWADRLTARSIVRFARAVRIRTGQDDAAESESSERPELSARTLEEYLRRLPRLPREALFLREGLSFDLAETARLVRLSRKALREHLMRAREGLYVRAASKDANGEVTGLPGAVESWFLLRDRDGSLVQTEAERDQQNALEHDPQVQRMEKELRELAQFLESGRFNRLTSRDRKLAEDALEAVRVASGGERDASLPADAHVDSDAAEFGQDEPHPWLQWGAHLASAALVLGSFVALAYHAPTPRRASGVLPRIAQRETSTPVVEALSVARTVENHGARLERAGENVGDGTLRAGDVITARARPGCFVMEPRADVCLAGNTGARIAQLGSTRRIELLSGRAVTSVERSAEGASLEVSVGPLRTQTTDGVLGVEIDGNLTIVRVLRGTARVFTENEAHDAQLTSARSAIYRAHEQNLEIVPQLIEKARRDWDLLASRSQSAPAKQATMALRPVGSAIATAVAHGAEAGVEAPTDPLEAEQGVAASEEPTQVEEAAPVVPTSPAPEEPATARTLLADARNFARTQRWNEAANSYEQLIHDYPHSDEAREGQVLLGELQLQHLAMPDEALATFDRYLAAGGGNFDLRARYGRILSLRRLGRVPEEQASIAQFLNLYRTTPQARVLLSATERDTARTP